MPSPSVYSYTFTVAQDVIDDNGHVNNVAYVQWMQEAALQHPEAIGYKLAENATWYAREHRIEYLLPAFMGDVLEVRTWLGETRRVRVVRHYEFTRLSDGKLIARGQTDWVYVDARSGKPIAIPADVQRLFSGEEP